MDLYQLAKWVHEQHLREAAKRDLYHRYDVALEILPLGKRLRARLGGYLIAWGNWLKTFPAVPIQIPMQAQHSVDRPKLKGIHWNEQGIETDI